MAFLSTFSLIFGSLPVVMFGIIAIGMAFMGDSIGGHVLQVSRGGYFTPGFGLHGWVGQGRKFLHAFPLFMIYS